MPASKVLETLLVCTCLAQSALSNDINDDFACDKVEKKSRMRFKRGKFAQSQGSEHN